MSDVRLRKPSERNCERCGRHEEWIDGNWRVDTDSDQQRPGSLHCIHEWDINGRFLPFEDPDA